MSKEFISAQMDTDLIGRLKLYADAKGITRSAAVREAVVKLLDPKS